ncbi:MAG: hypothetical protein JWM28_2218 [Chitinophagaceae bacterium]|nr:hypothetical protein [Chitinophagaceae bacterium]
MEHKYPSLSERIQSMLIDQVLIVVLMFAFASMLDQFENSPDWIRIVLFFGIWGVYEPIAMTFGGSMGNYAKGIRVRKFNSGLESINILQAYIRYFVKIALGWLSFLTINMNTGRRAVHDLAAATVMIKKYNKQS